MNARGWTLKKWNFAIFDGKFWENFFQQMIYWGAFKHVEKVVEKLSKRCWKLLKKMFRLFDDFSTTFSTCLNSRENDKKFLGAIIHGQAGGYWAPKYELVPKVTVDQKKRRQAKKSKYEFVLDLWIRIRIFTTNSAWAASQIRIGPLIFPLIRQIRGGGTVPPPPPTVEQMDREMLPVCRFNFKNL